MSDFLKAHISGTIYLRSGTYSSDMAAPEVQI